MKTVTHLPLKLSLTVLSLGILALAVHFSYACPVQALLGVPCPGCGMTRAWFAVLRLDFGRAFALHPFFWSVPVLYAYLMADGRLFRNRRLNGAVLAVLVGGWLIFAAARMFLPALQQPLYQ